MTPAIHDPISSVATPVLLQTPQGVVEYARSGTGPAVLCLHGAMGGYDQGLLLGRSALPSTGYQCVAVSRPGYFGTPLASGKTPERQADLCAAVLDALAIRQAAVIAISGGGQCALQFALRHPDRCRGLVMISACSAPIAGRIPLSFHLMTLLARIPAVMASLKKKAAAHPESSAHRSIRDPAVLARTLNDPVAWPLMRELQLSTMERMLERLPGTRNDIEQSRRPFAYPLEQVRTPLLAVHGTADQLAPFALSQSLAARVPGAELLTIDGGEHVSLFTHLHEIRARVAQFLDAHLPSEREPLAQR